MSENAGSIFYTVDIETDKTLKAQQQIDQGFDKLQKGMDQTDKSASRLGGGLSKLAVSIAAVVSAGAIREMAGLVQKYQEMAERVQMATASQAEFEMVQKRLLNTANQTYRRLDEAQELYIRTADSLRSMGYSTAQALDVTDSMSFAFVKNATSADRANAAISALSKSVNTGKVAADQWETITSAIPTVIDDIAAASGRTSAEIRALGAAGKLTAAQLTEGLRKSLEANTEAAAKMAANLTDAGVRARTALTTVLVSLEKQTGALQAVTDGIVAAANAMQEFGADSEKMAALMDSAATAGTALAVVIGSRLLASMAGYTAALVAQAAAAVSADRAAAASLRLAAAEQAAAAAALAQAVATERAAIGLSTHAAAATALTAAQTRVTASTVAFTAAQTRANAIATAGTVAMTGLRGALALLGGPLGVIFLAVGALVAFAPKAETAEERADELAKSVDGLTQSFKDLSATQLNAKLAEFAVEAAELEGQIDRLKTKQVAANKEFASTSGVLGASAGSISQYANATRELAEQDAEGLDLTQRLEANKKAAEAARKALEDIGKATSPGGAPAVVDGEPVLTSGTGEPGKTSKGKTDAERAAEAIRDQVDALELQADTLGMTTSELEIYKLELAGATDEQIRAAQSSLSLIDAFEQQAAAEKKIQQQREAFGTTPAEVTAKITGKVDPLSGGMFDSQSARYDAEAEAERVRYAEQMERLNEAKTLQLEALGGYQALELQMQTEHAARLAQIDAAKNQAMLASGQQLFDGLAGAVATFAGEQSGAYAALFAVSKAFAVAQAGLQLSAAMTQVLGDPTALTPAQKFANVAAVAAAGGALVSAVAGANFSGRAMGGPVQANQMYRVNEGGQPEIFNAANGQQYMMPNQRGEVVSNKDAGSGGSEPTVIVNIQNNANGTTATATTRKDDRQTIIDVVVSDVMNNGKIAQAVNRTTGTRRAGG